MDNILKDINYVFTDRHRELDMLLDKTIFITGATGIIGFNLILILSKYSAMHDNRIKIIAFVRNLKKATNMFSSLENIDFFVGDILDEIEYLDSVDYIIHGASITSSKAFIDTPVEIINTAIVGTKNVLNFARQKKVKSLVFLSTMEVYGHPNSDEKIDETHSSNINTMEVRSSYPESKRLCETLCCAYGSEYNIPIKVVRLTQTFGPGVNYNDNRIFAELGRCIIENKDIILHTKGETKRSYLYTFDAVSAMLLVLINGNNGESYNVANEETYCSIFEMAKTVAKECADEKICVKIELDNEDNFGFAPKLNMNLDSSKIRKLGWKPRRNLVEMFELLLDYMRINRYENINI